MWPIGMSRESPAARRAAHHVGIDKGHARLALHPPHRRLIVRPIHVPHLPPPRPRLDLSLLGVGRLLETSEGEELGTELARDEEEVVAPEELEADL